MYYLLDRFCENRWFPLLFIPIATCFLLLYSFTTSPLFLNDGMDSAVFKTMGLAILKGKIPYVDIFDHKGPILYFINALGQWLITGRMGIFLLQVIGLSITLFYWFKTARLFVNDALSFFSLLLTLFVFGGVIQEGNQCEEWMMYVFSIALYYALFHIVNKQSEPHPLKFGLLYGVCFGITFFIRPNDAVAMMGGIMTGIVIWLIYNKQYKNMVGNTLCFIAGTLIIAIPVVSFFSYHDAVDDLWYGMIGFNKNYSGGGLYLLKSIFRSQKTTVGLVYTALLLLIYCQVKNRTVMVLLFPVLLYEWILMGTALFPHYFIVLLPIYLVFIIFVALQFFEKQKNWPLIILSIGILFLSSYVGGESIIIQSSNNLKERLIPLAHGRAYNRIMRFYSETDLLLSKIPEQEIDSIWNYNLGWQSGGVSDRSTFSILWHNGLVQCNLITYGKNVFLRQKDNIRVKVPLWVVLDDDGIKEEKDLIKNNFIDKEYDLIMKTDTTICKIELYRRK